MSMALLVQFRGGMIQQQSAVYTNILLSMQFISSYITGHDQPLGQMLSCAD